MADPDHLARLQEGVHEWNEWRARSQVRPDLRHAPLSRASLAGYNLAGADCREAVFAKADLSGCEFAGANLAFADLRAAGVGGAIFSSTSLFHAELEGADFSGARMDNVNFNEAKLDKTIFRNAQLRFCEFANARLTGADFSYSSMAHVNLRGADLRHASFYKARLENACFTNSWIWETKTTDWDLAEIDCGSLRLGRDGVESEFQLRQFEEVFATRTIRVQLPDDRESFEAVDLQNLIYLLGTIRGSFSISLQTDRHVHGSPLRETTIKVDPQSAIDPAEIAKLNSVINGLKELEKDKDAALEILRRREASLKEKLVSAEYLMPWTAIAGELDGKERLTVVMFDLTGSSAQSDAKNLAATAKFWGIGVPLVKDRQAKYLNTWGDALIACFEDVESALDSAWELIAALKAIGIRGRAGVHHGDVWIRFNPLISRRDIAGPTVHMAARLEPLAEPCTVLASKEVRDLVRALKLGRFQCRDKHVTFQKGAGSHSKGDAYLASTITLHDGD